MGMLICPKCKRELIEMSNFREINNDIFYLYKLKDLMKV